MFVNNLAKLKVQQKSSVAVFSLIVQGNTHDDVLLLATSLLRVVVKTVITMDRSLSVVVSTMCLKFMFSFEYDNPKAILICPMLLYNTY